MNEQLLGNPARYDEAAAFYVAFVDRLLADPDSFWPAMFSALIQPMQKRLPGARVLDIACGEGHLARRLLQFGPREIIGVDISAALLDVARQRATGSQLHFQLDDAQVLTTIPDGCIDIAVSNLAIMDIPDHLALFQAVRRVLVPGGIFVFSMLHPCFEAPFHEPETPRFIVDSQGERVAYAIWDYATEGHWQSGGSGVRGRVGAYHHTLSTLINTLLAEGFQLRGLHEPLGGGAGLLSRVPQTLIVDVQKP